MRRLLPAMLAILLLIGCAERRLFITSDPSGARVYLNDQEIGVTPVEIDFQDFGVYDVRLTHDGYEPLWTRARADAPPHEWFGLDLIAAAIPGRERTHIRWHFDLEPEQRDPQLLLERAIELHDRFDEVETPAATAEGLDGSSD